jgi:hypothetical protein
VTTTTLLTNEEKLIERRGTSGFTVTATRKGDDVHVQMEFDIVSPEEAVAMIGELLAQLEELQGESFVANCIAHYADSTHKKFYEEEDHAFVLIRGKAK